MAKGKHNGPVAFDGEHFYAINHTAKGDQLDLRKRLKSVNGEFHYAESGFPPHNEIHGINTVHDLVPGSED